MSRCGDCTSLAIAALRRAAGFAAVLSLARDFTERLFSSTVVKPYMPSRRLNSASALGDFSYITVAIDVQYYETYGLAHQGRLNGPVGRRAVELQGECSRCRAICSTGPK